tara:strand:+ start:985 stop:1530 length:546 start_codon:yes stop_codon:yes gene_type:complete
MKKITLICCIAFGMIASAQPADFDFYLRVGNDPNMLIKGAYPDRLDVVRGLHNKYGFGFEFEHARIGMDLESFSEIGFTKWTYLYFDYKLSSVIRNVNFFAGLEMSQIKRHHPDFNGSDPNNYREYTINPLLFGGNLEAVYRKDDSHFGFGLQANMHQAEDELKPYKKFRFQVFGNLYFYF